MRRWPAGRSGPPEVSPAWTSVSGRLPETCPDRGAARAAARGLFPPAPSRSLRQLARAVALTALATLGITSGWIGPAAAQTTVTLVENATSRVGSVRTTLIAQAFVTGGNAQGYTLSQVELNIGSVPSSPTATVKIRGNRVNNGRNEPNTGTPVTLTNPDSFSTGFNTFTAPANTTLSANTRYWVTVDSGRTNSNQMSFRQRTGGGQTGLWRWSIDDNQLITVAADVSWSSNPSPLVLKIRGSFTDTRAPTVTSIERHNPATSPTNADSLTWRVTFNEPVTGVSRTNFGFAPNTGDPLPHSVRLSVRRVAGDGDTWDVTASGGDLPRYNGTVNLSIASVRGIQDTAGIGMTSVGVTGTNERTYTLDNTRPTVTITGVPATSTAAFTATFTFSEVVTGFTVGDIRVGNATVLDFTATTTTPAGSVYTALITPTISGVTTTVDVAANVAEDGVGNGNTAASRASSSYTGASQPVISIEAVHTHAMPYLADVEFRVSRLAAATTALTVSLSIAQTASYLRNTSPSVTIPANQASTTVKYNSTYSGATSGTVTATVAVRRGYAPAAAPANTATVNFVATGLPLTAGWAQDAYTVTEGETLSAGVTLRTRDGAPKPREDYSIGIETVAGHGASYHNRGSERLRPSVRSASWWRRTPGPPTGWRIRPPRPSRS